jgi:hypothetical protein
MFPPKKLLLPVDFSAHSGPATAMAAAFARRFDAQLTMLHVAPQFPERAPGIRRSCWTSLAKWKWADYV